MPQEKSQTLLYVRMHQNRESSLTTDVRNLQLWLCQHGYDVPEVLHTGMGMVAIRLYADPKELRTIVNYARDRFGFTIVSDSSETFTPDSQGKISIESSEEDGSVISYLFNP